MIDGETKARIGVVSFTGEIIRGATTDKRVLTRQSVTGDIKMVSEIDQKDLLGLQGHRRRR